MKKTLALLLCLWMLCGLAMPASAADSPLKNEYSFYSSYCGYLGPDGKPVFHEDFLTTDYIAVTSGDALTAGPFSKDQILYVTAFGADKNQQKQVTQIANLKQKVTLKGDRYLMTYNVPDGTAYVRVTFGAEYYNTFLVSRNRGVSAAEYEAWIDAQGLTRYLDFINADKSGFADKTLLWCGDSVGNGSYEKYYEGATTKTRVAFAGRVSHLLGMKSFNNTSSGGATLSTKYPSNIIPQKIEKNANANTDYLVIQGGIVDICGYNEIVVPLGYMSDSFDPASFAGPETFLGGLEKCFYLATKQAPDAVIVFVMCYSAPSNVNALWAWERCWQYVPAVCEKWGIPLISLYQNETVNAVFDHDRSVAGLMYYDNLHCTPMGYTACSLEIAMEMYGLPRYSAKNRVTPTNIPAKIAKDTWKEPDPGTPPVAVTVEGNLYDAKKSTKGMPMTGGVMKGGDKYVTSDFIPVEPGDVIRLAPCSPYEDCNITGYDRNRQNVTGPLDGYGVTATDFFTTGRLLYEYTVPEGIYFVRATFSPLVSPVITKNQPFTAEDYNAWLGAALGLAPVTAAAQPSAPAPETAPEPPESTVSVPGTDPAPATASPGTEPAKTSGCGASAAGLPLLLSLFAAGWLKKKRREP